MKTLATYRRANGDIFWHFRIGCEDWPQNNFDELKNSEHPPKRGGFCLRCIRILADERFVYLKNNFPFLVRSL
jgi:hypothetical protein